MLNIKSYLPDCVKAKLKPAWRKLKQTHQAWQLHKLETVALQSGTTPVDPLLLSKMRDFSAKYGTRYLNEILRQGWTNPGHMFDELGEIFLHNDKLFLIGTADEVDALARRLAFLGIEIERHCASQLTLYDIARLAGRTACGYTVVIAYKDENLANLVMSGMCRLGRHFVNVNIFSLADFIGDLVPLPKIYLPIYAIYTVGKTYLMHNNVLVTTRCNLNCEYCLNYTPYIKNYIDFTAGELKDSIDIYFSHIDYVELLQFTGGEPLLSNNLYNIIEYAADKYRNKIDILSFVTNGTITPDDKFLNLCKKYDIFIFLDDYTKSIPRIKDKFNETLHKIENADIKYHIPMVNLFIKSFPPMRTNMQFNEMELQHKYRSCHIGVQNLRDGRLCSCTYHAFAVNADLIPDAPENWFDMAKMSDDILDKRKLVEFRFGFNQKGYVDWCKYCNGNWTINKNTAPVAGQIKGKLHWDINNPTFLDEGDNK